MDSRSYFTAETRKRKKKGTAGEHGEGSRPLRKYVGKKMEMWRWWKKVERGGRELRLRLVVPLRELTGDWKGKGKEQSLLSSGMAASACPSTEDQKAGLVMWNTLSGDLEAFVGNLPKIPKRP